MNLEAEVGRLLALNREEEATSTGMQAAFMGWKRQHGVGDAACPHLGVILRRPICAIVAGAQESCWPSVAVPLSEDKAGAFLQKMSRRGPASSPASQESA